MLLDSHHCKNRIQRPGLTGVTFDLSTFLTEFLFLFFDFDLESGLTSSSVMSVLSSSMSSLWSDSSLGISLKEAPLSCFRFAIEIRTEFVSEFLSERNVVVNQGGQSRFRFELEMRRIERERERERERENRMVQNTDLQQCDCHTNF